MNAHISSISWQDSSKEEIGPGGFQAFLDRNVSCNEFLHVIWSLKDGDIFKFRIGRTVDDFRERGDGKLWTGRGAGDCSDYDEAGIGSINRFLRGLSAVMISALYAQVQDVNHRW